MLHQSELFRRLDHYLELGKLLTLTRNNFLADLPSWDEMSSLDKGCALMHFYKCETEGDEYAAENYPCQYLDLEILKALPPELACAHALIWQEAVEAMSGEDRERCSDIHWAACNA